MFENRFDEKTQSSRVNGIMGINNRKNTAAGYLLLSGLILSFLAIEDVLPFDPTMSYVGVIVLIFGSGQLYFFLKNGYLYSERVRLEETGLAVKKITRIPILPLAKEVLIPYTMIKGISLKSHEDKREMSGKGRAALVVLLAGVAIILSLLTLAGRLSVPVSAVSFLIIVGVIGVFMDSLRYGISNFLSGRTNLERLGLYDVSLELSEKTDEFEKEVHIYSSNGEVIFEKINEMLKGGR